ncbi:MAG: hypothetical protein G8237_08980 [Magnetococcales bacterium]|nr:hypothetical protein [Magnetococcales bacterium]
MNQWITNYRRIKQRIHWFMEENSCPYRTYFYFFMTLCILCSVVLLILEVQNNSRPHAKIYQMVGIGLTAIFAVEYLLRWWVNTSLLEDYRIAVEKHRRSRYRTNRSTEIFYGLSFALLHKLRWMVRPLSLVDLVAILPLFPLFRSLTALQLLKLFRYSKRVRFFSNLLSERRYEMTSLIYAGVIIWGMTAIAFFTVEHNVNDKVPTLSAAIYWSIITITTVGYGDITPVTETGRLIASLGVLVGMSITVMLTSLIVTIFTDRIFNLKEYHMEQMIARIQNHFIVCGLNALGEFTCQSLITENRPFIAIDHDQKQVDAALERGWIAICGDVNDAKTWQRARIGHASGVISSILNEATNIYLIMMARELNPKCFVVACGNQQNSEQRLLRIGADRVVSPYQNAGQYLAHTAIRPHALQFLNLALNQGYTDLVVEEISIAPGSVFDFTLLRDSKLREDFHGYVVGILSQGVKMITTPPPDYRLIAGDVLICLGHKLDLERLKHATSKMAIENVLERMELSWIRVIPHSGFIGTRIKDTGFRSRFRVQLVAMIHDQQVLFKLDPELRLTEGDLLVCLGFREQLDLVEAVIGEAAQPPVNHLGLYLERMHVPVRSFLRGKSLRHSMLRESFACNIVAVQPLGGTLTLDPLPDYRFTGDEIILCLGSRIDLDRLQSVLS